MVNSTTVIFADSWKLRHLHSMLLFLMYGVTLLGNLLVVTVTIFDQKLHMPLCFFLRNQSILDMCYITVIVLNACVNSLTGNRTISGAACTIQVFLVLYFAYVEVMFLNIMA